jgi:hypothetical protein
LIGNGYARKSDDIKSQPLLTVHNSMIAAAGIRLPEQQCDRAGRVRGTGWNTDKPEDLAIKCPRREINENNAPSP